MPNRQSPWHIRLPATCLLAAGICLATVAGVGAQTVDQDLQRCPTPAELASVNSRLSLTFANDPQAQVLACTAAAGSANLSLLKKRAYNSLLAMQRLNFDTPLPWTAPPTASLWDWFTLQANIDGIAFSYSTGGGNSSCCSPANVINIVVADNSYLSLTDRWDTYHSGPGGYGGGLGDTLALFVHEARHNQGYFHTCAGGNDQTFNEMGAWAIQSLLWYWIGNHGDPGYLRPVTNDVGADYYTDDARERAEHQRSTRICADARTFVSNDNIEFYNSGLKHYFMTANQAEAIGIDQGAAGPNWSRTGASFKIFPDPAHAPMNAMPVCRFYGTPGLGPNSHFFTIDPAECAQVKLDPGWTYEGIVFYMIKPFFDHTCSAYNERPGPPFTSSPTTRVLRLYNQRAAFGDSNHRYTTNSNTASVMATQGWRAEGVVLCSPQ